MPVQGLNEQLQSVTASLAYILPELILAGAILLILIVGLFSNKRHIVFSVLTIVVAIISLVLTATYGFQSDISLFDRMLYRDGFANFLILLVDVSVVLTCLMSLRSKAERNISEYYALLLAIALGGHLLLMSTSLLMIFLSLEVISLSSYVLAGYSFSRRGSEGSLKYFFFGSVASAIMLYGFTVMYGFSGTVDITSKQFFDVFADERSPLLLIGGLMSLSGFLFKIAAVPMQPWAPDVYQAAPMPVIAYLSVAPKLAALGILAKFLLVMHAYGQSGIDWQTITAVIAILTITVGNFSALWQQDAKRMMAYSSIAHSGFLLVGIAAFLPQGIEFMLFYAAVYLLMNYAVFIFLGYFEDRGYTAMPSFSGTGRMHVVAAAAVTIALVALTGLPPTAGFTAKLLIFSGLWEGYLATEKTVLLWLLIFGLLNTVISLFFYMRIPYYAFIKAGTTARAEKSGGFENFLGVILVVLIVVIFFIPGLLMGLINRINFVL